MHLFGKVNSNSLIPFSTTMIQVANYFPVLTCLFILFIGYTNINRGIANSFLHGKKPVLKPSSSNNSAGRAKPTKPVTDFVNPFIGTAGDHGQMDPSATLPFGMAKPGPETEPGNHSGYDYNAKLIRGFSQLRIGGTGCNGAGGNILIRPCLLADTASAVLYDKKSEKAWPGYYKVKLQNPEILTEISATQSVSAYKFTFPNAGKFGLMVDLTASHEKMVEFHSDYTPGTNLSGFVKAKTVCGKGNYKVFYAFGYSVKPGAIIASSGEGKFILPFQLPDTTLEVFIALSSISEKDAREKLDYELGRHDFKWVSNAAYQTWNRTLSAVKAYGTQEQMTLFYTHLYHSCISPVQIQNKKGLCRGMDGGIRIDPLMPQYAGFSTWDNFRTELPLLSLLYPDTMKGICRSIGWLYKEGRNNWATQTEPYATVRTEHSIVTLADCLNKGITGLELPLLYPLLVADTINFTLKTADQYLETAYDYWALAEIAKKAGKPDDAKRFYKRSLLYKPVWEEKLKPIGTQSDIMHGGGIYEGTPWQYRWFVPHDIKGIQESLGEELFTSQLETFFQKELYNHGNQPDIQAPWLFNFTQKPWLSQYYVNQYLAKEVNHWYGTHNKWKKPLGRKTYTDTPDGYIEEMDDDAGTMSAWYVWGAMGLYPACVGAAEYLISAPLLRVCKFKLASGKELVISAPNVSEANIYIQSLTWNGKPWNRTGISHEELMKGGILLFDLGPKPNVKFGTDKKQKFIPSVKANLEGL